MATCKIVVEVCVDRKVVTSKTWPACDIMRTGHTRGWATRQFNAFLKDFNECPIGKDKIISVEWVAQYGEAQGHQRITGRLGGVNGRALSRRGIFEDYKRG